MSPDHHIKRDPTAELDSGVSKDNAWEDYYLSNLIKNTPHNSRIAYMICHHLELGEFRTMAGVQFPKKKKAKKDDSHAYVIRDGLENKGANKEDWEVVKRYFAEKAKQINLEDPDNRDAALDNIDRLASVLGLSEPVRKALVFFYMNKYLSDVLDGISREVLHEKRGLLLARVLDDTAHANAYVNLLKKGGVLFNFGLVHYFPVQDSFPGWDINIINRMISAEMTEADLGSMIVGLPAETELTIDDFNYLGDQLTEAVDNLRVALETGERGFCIFLHGKQGTGKTELGKAIAKAVGGKLYSIGEKNSMRVAGATEYYPRDPEDFDDDFDEDFDDFAGGGEMDRIDPLDETIRADKILAEQTDAILLADEAERFVINTTDAGKPADPRDKLKLNRAFESNRRPIIVCVNDVNKLHPSLRSRMAVSIEMQAMPTLVRLKIWKKRRELIGGLNISDKELLSLARKYEVEPRAIRQALMAFKRTGRKGAIEHALRASANITEGSPLATETGTLLSDEFDPALINVTHGAQAVERLTEAVKEKMPAAVLIKAMPGRGADELLEFAAEQASAHLVEHDGADLSTPSAFAPAEVKIMGAFASAAANGNLMVVSNLEALTGEGGREVISDEGWKSPLIQLFASKMVEHPSPVVVVARPETAKDMPDYLRALFMDVVELDTMTPEQAARAYQAYIRPQVPNALANVHDLVVNDFVLTRRMVRMLEQRGKVRAPQILEILQGQRDIRMGNESGGGFGYRKNDKPEKLKEAQLTLVGQDVGVAARQPR